MQLQPFNLHIILVTLDFCELMQVIVMGTDSHILLSHMQKFRFSLDLNDNIFFMRVHIINRKLS